MSIKSGGMVLLICSIIYGCTQYDSPHLKDDRLTHVFLENEREFQRLAADLKADCNKGLTRVDIDWTDPVNPKQIGITESEIRRYREIFKLIGIKRGYSSVNECRAIELITSSQGLSVSGSSKGYYYSEIPPRNIVASLFRLSRKWTFRPFEISSALVLGSWGSEMPAAV